MPSVAELARNPLERRHPEAGGEDEATRARNLAAVADWRLLHRSLVGVSRCDVSTVLFERRMAIPVAVAPDRAQRARIGLCFRRDGSGHTNHEILDRQGEMWVCRPEATPRGAERLARLIRGAAGS